MGARVASPKNSKGGIIKATQGPRRIASRLKKSAIRAAGKDYVAYKGAKLPPPGMRYCGASFRDDETFLTSSDSEAERLVNDLGIGEGSRIYEIGGGPGRMPIGLIRQVPGIELYHGVDLDPTAIDWCTRHITSDHPNYVFTTVEAQHDRYSPDGPVMDETFTLPTPNENFDLVYVYGVFANMVERDIRVYLDVFRKALRPGGRLFVTAFVEEDVPPITINPENYAVQPQGPLNVARYEKSYFLSFFADAGFRVDRYDYGTELDTMSAVYLTMEERS